ncbi:MAG: hypothetical protein FJW34_21940, partial [Acidobacteria bacterium]|nr:hypothetical protein [Acidobacteriota bacterium]
MTVSLGIIRRTFWYYMMAAGSGSQDSVRPAQRHHRVGVMTSMRLRLCVTLVLCAGTVCAQAPTGPVISPRGVINAFTQQPAPSTAPQGGIIHILGLNLGPPGGVKSTGAPLPVQLGDPPIEVLINGKQAPLLSAQPERIVAQIPWEADPGLAQVVVRRGGIESKPARVIINALAPSVRTEAGAGFGEVFGQLKGEALTFTGFGLGPTQPRVATGEAAPEDPPTRPRLPVAAFVGGLPARAAAVLSKERVGEFDIRIQVPAGAQPGDILTLTAGNSSTGVRSANRATYQKLSAAELQYVPAPTGAPEFRSLVTSDLRGSFVIASAARQENGCYPSFVFDLARRRADKIEECLTTPARNAATPVVAGTDGSALAALAGPPVAEPPAGISSKVMLFSPVRDAMTVELEAAASNLVSAPGGDFEAVLPGTPPQRVLIDSETGETQVAAPAAGGGTQPAQINLAALKIDLGDGLTHVLGLAGLPQNQFAVIVADDADNPKKAKIAVLNPRGEVLGTVDFPDGWAPLVAPPPPQRPAAQAGGAAVGLRRISVNFDPQKGVFYVLVRTPDN